MTNPTPSTGSRRAGRSGAPDFTWRGWWQSDRLNDARLLRRVWLIGHALLLAQWVLMRFTLGDTRYYFDNISRMGELGPRRTMVEYPTPVLWFLKLPDLVSFGQRWVYVLVFFLMMMALDAAFTRSLWLLGGRNRGKAVLFWSVFIPLIGTTAYLRFDIVTAVLAGWALIELARRRPGVAGMLVGAGAAIKLWPALLWPALLNRPDDKGSAGRATLGIFGFGGVLALVSLAWAGWDRLLSPLTWQGERGLQIESLWATVPMVLRVFHPERYLVAVSPFNAWEVSGPTTDLFLKGASLAFAVGLLAAVAAYLWWIRRGHGRLVEAAAMMLLVILVMIVTNKTFSPQYIIWLGGPLAAAWAMASENPVGSVRAARDEHEIAVVSELTFLATLLTQLVYPLTYAALVQHRPGLVLATIVLAARNLVLLWLFIRVTRWIWSFLRTDGRA
ncbi:glycosyltransferase family 87 protein [Luteococcus sanguinis]|uniref:Glycosyltransferase 87 family protein n=1 Tax=Luteococcus sanguinis TaxID=174038 RepID=A0ABW1X607_9ACTN